MEWRVVVRPEAGEDMIEVAKWYDSRQEGLGDQFVGEVLRIFDALAENPRLGSRRHPHKDIHWCYPERFPYRIIYEVAEASHTVIVAAVLPAARHDGHWRKRL